MSAIVAAIKSFFSRLFGTAEADIRNEIDKLRARVASLEANVKKNIGSAETKVVNKIKGL